MTRWTLADAAAAAARGQPLLPNTRRQSAMSWMLVCSIVGATATILALFLSSNNFLAAEHVVCILLNLAGGVLLSAGATGNAVDSGEFIPFVVLNVIFALIALMALGRWCRRRLQDSEHAPASDKAELCTDPEAEA